MCATLLFPGFSPHFEADFLNVSPFWLIYDFFLFAALDHYDIGIVPLMYSTFITLSLNYVYIYRFEVVEIQMFISTIPIPRDIYL